jgi:hypothetical protein
MPVIILFFGFMILASAYYNTYSALFSQLSTDFPPFLPWLGVLVILWFIGELPGMDKLSKAFLTLLIVVFIIANKGLFANLQAALSGNATAPAPQTNVYGLTTAAPETIAVSSPGAGSGGSSPAGSPGGASSVLGGIAGMFGL